MDFSIKRLDHLGIIAGVMQDLKLVSLIDGYLQPDIQIGVTPGEAVASMVLNGLGFSNRVTTLTPQFYATKPMDLLIGRNITEEQLNRHKLGRTLDKIADYGCEKLFNAIALSICVNEKIDLGKAQNDTTTFSVEGSYDNQEEDAEVHITHGYSKARRPDLKQIVLELVVSADGGAPFIMKPWSGNAADSKIFNARIKALKEAAKESSKEMILIADSKLYTKENIEALQHAPFITRVPATISAEQNHISTALQNDSWTKIDNGYKFQAFNFEHYGIKQRWVVFYSQQARDRAEKTLDKLIKKQTDKLNKDLFHLQAQRFSCDSDAQKALSALIKKYPYHKIIDSNVTVSLRHEKVGRPALGAAQATNLYQIRATTEVEKTAVMQVLNQRSCFVLATNIVENKLAAADIIKEYKDQDYVEKGFAFMKAPSFFAAAFYIKSVARIQAMLVVMTLALLVYTVAQRRLRSSLAINKKTIPNQIKKPTARPTLRWAFQIIEGIDYVKVYAVAGPIQTVIQGLTDLKKLILSCFGKAVMKIYRIEEQLCDSA